MAWQLFRDDYGIPHLRADSTDEVAFAQGHTAAVDRCWQIELARLRGEGRVAGLLGGTGLEWDSFARRARIEETAKRAYEGLGPESRTFVGAYVAGVNDALASGRAVSRE